MIAHPGGILPPTARPIVAAIPQVERERERLRAELLRRIIDREIRRRASRGGLR
jgi:hypothetical protein